MSLYDDVVTDFGQSTNGSSGANGSNSNNNGGDKKTMTNDIGNEFKKKWKSLSLSPFLFYHFILIQIKIKTQKLISKSNSNRILCAYSCVCYFFVGVMCSQLEQ